MQMSDFLDVFDLRRADVQNWIARPTVQLHTEYADTVAGAAREFSRQNVIELATIGALVSAGAKPSDAAMWSEVGVDAYRNPHSTPVRFMIFPANRFDMMETCTKLDGDHLTKLISSTHKGAVVIIDVGSIIDRANDLFKGYEK